MHTPEARAEAAFWAFDEERKRTGAERDAFKRQALGMAIAMEPCEMCDNGDGHLRHTCPRVPLPSAAATLCGTCHKPIIFGLGCMFDPKNQVAYHLPCRPGLLVFSTMGEGITADMVKETRHGT